MKYFILILTAISCQLLFSQENLPVTYQSIDSITAQLIDGKQEIKDNHILNEQLIDLLSPYTIDSTYTRKTERHQMFGAAIFRVLGIRWRTVKYTREKFVGTIARQSIPGSEEAYFTEYDVNYDLIPHTKPYIDLAYEAYQAQFDMKKSNKKKQADEAPYIYPDENTDLGKYRFHCEVTPHKDFRTALNTTFYPVMAPMTLEKHSNFQEPNPSIGLYGPLVLDCNHKCHPEIHPYEWIWWYDLTDIDSPNQVWHIGFLRDNSNRFKHWSSAPRTGVIDIPFAFPLESDEWSIDIEHQLFNGFDEAKINELPLPDNFKHFDQESWSYSIADLEKNITVNSNLNITSTGIGYWIDDISIDKESGIVAGKFHLAMANDDVYTAEVTSSFEKNNTNTDFAKLQSWMQGRFNSSAQAAADTNYYDITLHMYPIWGNEPETWLYVEQAVTQMQDRPYRQRIYKLSKNNNGNFTSDIYLLPDNASAVGQWKNPDFFNQWTPDSLTLKDGCTVFLEKKGDTFVGGTVEDNCPSTLYGASYATTEVKISADEIMSWDRGFDSNNEHIWGAENGGYFFEKVK